MIDESNPDLLAVEWGKAVHDLVKAGKRNDAFQMWVKELSNNYDPSDNPKVTRTIWERAYTSPIWYTS